MHCIYYKEKELQTSSYDIYLLITNYLLYNYEYLLARLINVAIRTDVVQ